MGNPAPEINTSFEVEIREASDVPAIAPVRLLWTDVPFGTGKVQCQRGLAYDDPSDTGYVIGALSKWVRLMANNGTVVVCCDYRLAADVVEAICDRCAWIYRGEIIWEFGLGRPRKTWWPVRHNNLLTFTATDKSGIFNTSAIPRTKRLSPKPGYPDDKPSGSVWEYTMNNTNPERVGYPNQKPTAIIEPFVLAHTMPGDLVVDPFMGSGSTGVAALRHGRHFYGADTNVEAVKIAHQRLLDVCAHF